MEKKNIIQRIKDFLSDIRGELKKVTWPTKSDMQKTTVAVIVLSIIIGVYLQVVDFSFRILVDWVVDVFK